MNGYKSNNVNKKLRLRWSLLPSPTTSASDSGAGAPGAPKKAGSHRKEWVEASWGVLACRMIPGLVFSLKLTANDPENRPSNAPKGNEKVRIPSIHF